MARMGADRPEHFVGIEQPGNSDAFAVQKASAALTYAIGSQPLPSEQSPGLERTAEARLQLEQACFHSKGCPRDRQYRIQRMLTFVTDQREICLVRRVADANVQAACGQRHRRAISSAFSRPGDRASLSALDALDGDREIYSDLELKFPKPLSNLSANTESDVVLTRQKQVEK